MTQVYKIRVHVKNEGFHYRSLIIYPFYTRGKGKGGERTTR